MPHISVTDHCKMATTGLKWIVSQYCPLFINGVSKMTSVYKLANLNRNLKKSKGSCQMDKETKMLDKHIM